MGVGCCAFLCACSLGADVPHRGEGAAPANSGVTLSGGAPLDAGTPVGMGEPPITDIKAGASGGASANATPGGADLGGAPDEGGLSDALGSAGSSQGDAAGDGGGDAGASAAGAASVAPPILFFSEVVEGSSSYKALEIAAQGRASLDGCKVETYFNGKTEGTVVATLSGVLEAGEVLTLCSSSLQEKLGAAVCQQVGNLTFNGDDALVVSCAGTSLDVFGQIGVDPGSAWGSGMNSTLDHTLRRACNVMSGSVPSLTDASVFDPSDQWQAFPVDTFDGLGKRGC